MKVLKSWPTVDKDTRIRVGREDDGRHLLALATIFETPGGQLRAATAHIFSGDFAAVREAMATVERLETEAKQSAFDALFDAQARLEARDGSEAVPPHDASDGQPGAQKGHSR